jgi:predicted transcriptional regulator
MTTITTPSDNDLKARVAAAGERACRNPHALILDAITQTVEQVEPIVAFQRAADQRWTNISSTGKTVGWDEAKSWLEARSRGEYPPRPAVRTFRTQF